MEVLDKIKQVVELLDELDDYLDLLPGLQSESDQRISDIYHYIETNSRGKVIEDTGLAPIDPNQGCY